MFSNLHMLNTLTVPVGQQLHQAVQARVPHLTDVGGAAADGLDGGSHKVFVHAFNVRLQQKHSPRDSFLLCC